MSLVDRINNFDMYFEFSDDYLLYDNREFELREIRIALQNTKENIFDLLNENGKKVYNRYLKQK